MTRSPSPLSVPDFHLQAEDQISLACRHRHIYTFQEAAAWIGQLPYRRNTDKNNPLIVLEENCGTCSTKHAFLKRLADENSFPGLRMMIGIYAMDKLNTPKVAAVLDRYQLSYIPEAHCYLRYHDTILDYTFHGHPAIDFSRSLMEETEIEASECASYKIQFHQTFLENWLKHQTDITMSTKELWMVREHCIEELS